MSSGKGLSITFSKYSTKINILITRQNKQTKNRQISKQSKERQQQLKTDKIKKLSDMQILLMLQLSFSFAKRVSYTNSDTLFDHYLLNYL